MIAVDTNHALWNSASLFKQEYRECGIKVLFIHVFLFTFLLYSPCMYGYNQVKTARGMPLFERKFPRY